MLDDESYNGWVRIVVGVLTACMCGTCTYSAVTTPDNQHGLATLAWVVGGAPTAFGIWLLASGIEQVWSSHRRD